MTMASNRNQHFVPRCYLRPFAAQGTGAAINLYNVDRRKVITGAPLKHQCSGDYFYGRDARLEKAIQGLEVGYATVLRAVVQPGYVLSDDHRSVLRLFWLFQHLRTEAASIRSVQMTELMGRTAGIPHSEYRVEIKDAVQMAMHTFIDERDVVDDLKICLIRNRTEMPFVTSDDPAILTNRWYLQDRRTRGRSFGLKSAGNLLLLPMTPKILCVGYDGDVCSVPNEKGWANVGRQEDVDAFNEHQFLNCRANIFFQGMSAADLVHEAYMRAEPRRPKARHRAHYAVLDGQDADRKKYRVVDPSQAPDHLEALIHTEVVHARPATWPHVIAWRKGGAVYTNGTGVGYVRRRETFRRDTAPFRKEPIQV
jgi:hypothetical protein